jgi:hypothetical protein
MPTFASKLVGPVKEKKEKLIGGSGRRWMATVRRDWSGESSVQGFIYHF